LVPKNTKLKDAIPQDATPGVTIWKVLVYSSSSVSILFASLKLLLTIMQQSVNLKPHIKYANVYSSKAPNSRGGKQSGIMPVTHLMIKTSQGFLMAPLY
jgi:hypothetical protein